jgi:23S rRNA (uracil1939-C5)-methyltransferase
LLPEVGQRLEDLSALIGSLDAKRDIAQIEIAAGDDTVALVFRHLVPLSESDCDTLQAFGQRHQLAILLQPHGRDSVHALRADPVELHYRIHESDVDLRFKPLDFVQVNAGINQRMVAATIALLDLDPGDRVLDLFCGLGNFTLPIARCVGDIVGVEGDAGLVERADANARRNGIANATFHAADLASNQAASAWAGPGYDKLLLDPPRSGAAAVLDYLPRKGTDRIVYVSCHPGSLARDAGTLVNRHGFSLTRAGVMDMFPNTAHVESIALFER